MDIKTINEQILELQRERDKVVEIEYKKLEEEFLKLDWLRATRLYFIDNGSYVGEGMHKFVLSGNNEFAKKIITSLSKIITLSGDSKRYQDNIIISKSWMMQSCDFEIRTNNAKLLVEFINKYDLKIGSSDKKTYQTTAELYQTLASHGVY